MTCKQCLTENPKEANFCTNCGFPLIKSDRLHHIFAIIISLVVGGPISAIATHFIWKLKIGKKSKIIISLFAIIIINILSIIIIYLIGKDALKRYLLLFPVQLNLSY